MIQTYNGMLLSHQKERDNAICSNTDGLRDYQTERSKSDRERQIPYDITYVYTQTHTCGIYKMTQMNPVMKQKQTHRLRK